MVAALVSQVGKCQELNSKEAISGEETIRGVQSPGCRSLAGPYNWMFFVTVAPALYGFSETSFSSHMCPLGQFVFPLQFFFFLTDSLSRCRSLLY